MFYVFDFYLGENLKDWVAEDLKANKISKQEFQLQLQELEKSRLKNTQPSLSLASYTSIYTHGY